jgi:hypothetical protein
MIWVECSVIIVAGVPLGVVLGRLMRRWFWSWLP